MSGRFTIVFQFSAGIGAAFTILSDADKRAHYDRYGEEGESSASAAGHGHGESRQRYYQRYEEEISPEDIFNMFFGMGARHTILWTPPAVFSQIGPRKCGVNSSNNSNITSNNNSDGQMIRMRR
jgi:DnaJ-class molecular chaperone